MSGDGRFRTFSTLSWDRCGLRRDGLRPEGPTAVAPASHRARFAGVHRSRGQDPEAVLALGLPAAVLGQDLARRVGWRREFLHEQPLQCDPWDGPPPGRLPSSVEVGELAIETTATVTVLFCDVVDSTARHSRLGDARADELRRRLFSVLDKSVGNNGGHVVKTLGDGLMAVFERSTVGALNCAVAMHEAAVELDPEDPVELRVGISVGEVSSEAGDWFGTPVIEAARLCAAAPARETLANATVASLVGSRGDSLVFRNVGTRSLKGLPDPTPVVEVHRGSEHGEPTPAAQEREVGNRRAVFLSVVALLAVLAIVGVSWTLASSRGNQGEASVSASGDPEQTADLVSEPIGYTPETTESDCAPLVQENIPASSCGELLVPENRRDPDSRTIAIPYVKAPAAEPTEADPIVMLGFNEHVNRSSLRDVADVYYLSLRGYSHVGAEEDMTCPELGSAWEQAFELRPDDQVGIDNVASAAGECATRLRSQGVDLDGYNLREVAADIRDLAIAVGEEQVSVATEQTLATAASVFANSNPDRVSSLLLTNPVPPGVSPEAQAPVSTARALDHLSELCGVSAPCSTSFGDVEATFANRGAQLTAQPSMVSTLSLQGEGPFNVLLDGLRLGAAAEAGMRSSALVGVIPSSLGAGSDELIAAVSINDPIQAFAGSGARAAADLSFRCSYDFLASRLTEGYGVAEPTVAGAQNPAFPAMCEAWGVEDRFPELSDPLRTDVPVFVAEGGFAAAGLNDWGEEFTELVDDPVLIRFDTLSEDLIFDPPTCLRELRNQFVQDPAAVRSVAECERQSPEIQWATG